MIEVAKERSVQCRCVHYAVIANITVRSGESTTIFGHLGFLALAVRSFVSDGMRMYRKLQNHSATAPGNTPGALQFLVTAFVSFRNVGNRAVYT